MIGSPLCSPDDREYVLSFLSKIDQQNQKQVQKLSQMISLLQKQKQKLEKQLAELKNAMKRKEIVIKDLQQQIKAKTVQYTKQLEKIQQIKKLENDKRQSDKIIKYLSQYPIQIINSLKQIPQNNLQIKPEQEPLICGNLVCIIVGKDKLSFQKYENKNRKFLSSFLKTHENKIQLMIIYNTK